MWKQKKVLTKPIHPWMRSKSGKILMHASLWIPLIVALIGFFFSNCIPAPISITLGLGFGVLCGLWWIAWVEVGYHSGIYSNMHASTRKYLKPWIRLPISLWAGFMFGYGAFAWGLPWVANSVVGSVSEEVVTVTGWEGRTLRSCSKPEIGRSLFVLSPRALCLPSSLRNRLIPGTRLRIVGPSTFLGINAEKIYIVK